MFPHTCTAVQQLKIYVHIVLFLSTAHSNQWLHNVVLSVGLEGKTVGRGGFKRHTDIHAQSESDCEIQQDGGRRVKDDLRVKWTQTEDGSCLSAHIASGRAVNSITPLCRTETNRDRVSMERWRGERRFGALWLEARAHHHKHTGTRAGQPCLKQAAQV